MKPYLPNNGEEIVDSLLLVCMPPWLLRTCAQDIVRFCLLNPLRFRNYMTRVLWKGRRTDVKPECKTKIKISDEIQDKQGMISPRRRTEQEQPSLYIYNQGFEMPGAAVSSIQLRSSINVFNLGLVHQLKNRRAEKARDFYKLTVTLLALEMGGGSTTEIIQIAVTNNYGVWCNENREPQEARYCMKHLTRLLAHFQGQLSPDFTSGLRSNIRCFGL